MAELKQKVESLPSKPKGLLSIVGSMADNPEFDDVMEYVRRQKEEELAAFDAEEK